MSQGAVAQRCLACSNCTLVCPTCFCMAVEDTTDLSGAATGGPGSNGAKTNGYDPAPRPPKAGTGANTLHLVTRLGVLGLMAASTVGRVR